MKKFVEKVVEGGEKGLTGVVKDVNGSNVTVLLTALPGQLSIVELYKSRQLAKHFSVGDHVLIIAGKYKVRGSFVVFVLNVHRGEKRVKLVWFQALSRIL